MENTKTEIKTIYEKWLHGEINCLGGFATSLMQTYMRADWQNSKKLEKAFPEYFVKKT
jgi:hypothetical protein